MDDNERKLTSGELAIVILSEHSSPQERKDAARLWLEMNPNPGREVQPLKCHVQWLLSHRSEIRAVN